MDMHGGWKRISSDALSVWRITGAFTSAFFWMLFFLFFYLTRDWRFHALGVILGGITLLLLTIFLLWILPSLRMKRWRYRLDEHEIEIQHGLFIITRTLVPMNRVQHVEIAQGPLLRKYELATIEVSTAATTHSIPALDKHEAEQVRIDIARMARLADEDV